MPPVPPQPDLSQQATTSAKNPQWQGQVAGIQLLDHLLQRLLLPCDKKTLGKVSWGRQTGSSARLSSATD